MVEKNELNGKKNMLEAGQKYDLGIYEKKRSGSSTGNGFHPQKVKVFEGLELKSDTQIYPDLAKPDNVKKTYTLTSDELRSIEEVYADYRQKVLSSDITPQYTAQQLREDLEDIEEYYINAMYEALVDLDSAFLQRELNGLVSTEELEFLQNLDSTIVISV